MPRLFILPIAQENHYYLLLEDYPNLFGTATMEDVNILKAHINALTKNSRQVAKFMKMQTHHFTSFMATTNKRFDNIQESVRENFEAITNLSKVIETLLPTVYSKLFRDSRAFNSFNEKKCKIQ